MLDGDAHVVQVAEAPARVRGGVMSRRPDQGEGGLALAGKLCGPDRGPGGHPGHVVQLAAFPLNAGQMRHGMHQAQLLAGGGLGCRHPFQVLYWFQGLQDRLHAPGGSCRVVGVVRGEEGGVVEDVHEVRRGGFILSFFGFSACQVGK